MEDNEFWVRIMSVLILSVAILLIILATLYHFRILGMANLGYCEVQGYGSSTLLWQKCAK